jgi:hypothetical protein
LNAQPNIIGDGINVAQRVMAFAKAGQILVSRSYYEIVSHISEGYTKLFSYEGSRTDKHVREHEIYSVGYSTANEAIRSPAQRAQRVQQVQRVANSDLDRAASSNLASARLLHHFERWLGNRSLAYGTAAFSSVTFLLALLTSFLGETPQPHEQTRAAPAPKKLASTATTVTKIGTVSDSEPVLTTGETQKQNTAQSDAADTAQEQPVPAPRKMKLRLPFFRTESDEEPAEIPAEQASPEQAQGDTQAEESAPGAADAAEETRAVTEFTADQPSMSASIVAAPLQSGYAERATVTLAISPWGEVYIDGKRIGVSPPVNEVEVLPGRRVIEIRNGDFPPYTQQVELRARQKIKVRYKFN